MLDLGALDRHVLVDRGVGPDVGVSDLGTRADDRRPADSAPLEPRARLDYHATLDTRVDELTVDARHDVLEDQPIRLEDVLELAGVLPPASHDVGLDAQTAVHKGLDRVGDLELVPPGRLDRARGVEDHG